MSGTRVRLTQQDIDSAFSAEQLVVFYQPQLSLGSGEIASLEAFIRWDHPKFGLMAPNLFLNFMESQGRIHEVTKFVLKRAIESARILRSKNLDWPISINIPLGTLLEPSFVETLTQLVNTPALGPGRLSLDIPEGALAARYLEDWPDFAPVLAQLEQAGIGLALDGPGARPFELRQIKPFPFTEVKIGGQSIINFALSTVFTRRGLIPSRVAFADKNHLTTTAVGVENEETLHALVDLGFDRVQGRLFRGPSTLRDLLSWYEADYAAKIDALAPALRLAKEPMEPAVDDRADVAGADDPSAGDPSGSWLDRFAKLPVGNSLKSVLRLNRDRQGDAAKEEPRFASGQ